MGYREAWPAYCSTSTRPLSCKYPLFSQLTSTSFFVTNWVQPFLLAYARAAAACIDGVPHSTNQYLTNPQKSSQDSSSYFFQQHTGSNKCIENPFQSRESATEWHSCLTLGTMRQDEGGSREGDGPTCKRSAPHTCPREHLSSSKNSPTVHQR